LISKSITWRLCEKIILNEMRYWIYKYFKYKYLLILCYIFSKKETNNSLHAESWKKTVSHVSIGNYMVFNYKLLKLINSLLFNTYLCLKVLQILILFLFLCVARSLWIILCSILRTRYLLKYYFPKYIIYNEVCEEI